MTPAQAPRKRVRNPAVELAQFRWFKDERYEQAADFSARSWWGALKFRSSALETEPQTCKYWFEEIRADPLKAGHGWMPFYDLVPVSEMSLAQASALVLRIANTPVEAEEERWEEWKRRDSAAYYMHVAYGARSAAAPRPRTLTDFLLECARTATSDQLLDLREEMKTAQLVIDLTAPDATLTAAFESWLRARREAMSDAGVPHEPRMSLVKRGGNRPVKEFGRRHFNKWIKHKVLQQLDLRIACRALDIEPRSALLGHLLFEKGERSPTRRANPAARRVDQDITPIADAAISYETLRALRAQMFAEMDWKRGPN